MTPGTSHFKNVPAMLPPKRRDRFAPLAIAEGAAQENPSIQLFIGDFLTASRGLGGAA
jgi:hypothetical protein